MGLRVKDVIRSLDYDDLIKLKKDLDSGSVHIKRLISEQIRSIENEHKKTCSVCASPINMDSTTTFTLIFGPYDFKKKATFCAIDCLQYFLSQLKRSYTKNTKKEVEDATKIRSTD